MQEYKTTCCIWESFDMLLLHKIGLFRNYHNNVYLCPMDLSQYQTCVESSHGVRLQLISVLQEASAKEQGPSGIS